VEGKRGELIRGSVISGGSPPNQLHRLFLVRERKGTRPCVFRLKVFFLGPFLFVGAALLSSLVMLGGEGRGEVGRKNLRTPSILIGLCCKGEEGKSRKRTKIPRGIRKQTSVDQGEGLWEASGR